MSRKVPDAPEVPGQEDVLRWIRDFRNAIRSADYTAGKKLFHPKIIAFDSSSARLDGLESLEAKWQEDWPQNSEFDFLIRDASVIPALGMFVIAVEWCVPSAIVGGNPRLGRSTIVLLNFEGKLLCAHLHNSPSP